MRLAYKPLPYSVNALVAGWGNPESTEPVCNKLCETDDPGSPMLDLVRPDNPERA